MSDEHPGTTDETPTEASAAVPEGPGAEARESERGREIPQPADGEGEPTEPDPDPRGTRVRNAVQAWTRHLVDLGGRNTLLWYRDLPTGTLDLTTAHPGGLASLLAGKPTKLSGLVRERAALDEARRRARAIAAKTKELREERGIATGFIAIGMATWIERKATRRPAAPVLLRSCILRPTSPAQDDFIVDLGQEVELNPVLRHYLTEQQGIALDVDALEEMATVTGGFDPYPVYATLSTLCAGLPDFEVHPRLVVGNFSYAKLPMVADLAEQGADLANHDVVAALAGDPDALKAVRDELPDGPTQDADPEREHLVLDADSTQVAAIEAVRSGAHLVIKGPPGTGKSQTIVNLIATLTGAGKRVLFVAEKRAAIDAVVDRLDTAGLGGLVLDLYDGAASRRRTAQQLGAALEAAIETAGSDGRGGPDSAATLRDLRARRQTLTEHVTALHGIREPWGVSAYAAQEAVSTLTLADPPPRSRVRLRGDTLRRLTRADVEQLARDLTHAGTLGAWDSEGVDDPWYRARVTTPDEAATAREVTARLAGGSVDAMGRTMDEVFAKVRLPEASTVADWGQTLGAVSRVRDTLEVFRAEVFDIPLEDLVAATGTSQYRREHGSDLGFFARRRFRRQARGLLRPGAPPADLHAALLEAGEQRNVWRSMAGGGGRPEIPADLDAAESAYESLTADLRWLGEHLEETAAGGDLLHTALPELRARLAALDARPERLAIIPTVIGTLDEMRSAGLQPIVDDFADRHLRPEHVAAELDHIWWTSLIEELALRDPAYGAHSGDALRGAEDAYAVADRRYLSETAARVRAAVSDRVEQVRRDVPQQEALVRAEASRARRHRSLRDLLPVAGDLVTAVKPCWVMSPLVVASTLPPGHWFDVVIFDEASQIPPAEAISAISRARQVVVAGDERQLPPTTFFTATPGDLGDVPDDGFTEGFESILDVLSAALPTRQLSWHYRSQDERLIAFANDEVYAGSLVTFPGAPSEDVLRLELVDGQGVIAEGDEAVETTTAEVDRVVELVLEHARTRPTESLGVIALGIKHATRLEDAVRRAVGREPGVERFFADDRSEPFFVKNLERVQGDERDAVILSIGYGKTPHGRVLHRFGPLNLEGGERRLNVAVTRARRRMTVVSSLAAEDLDPARLKARGAQLLRDYLAYAATGGRPPVTEGIGEDVAPGAGHDGDSGTGHDSDSGVGGDATAGPGGGGAPDGQPDGSFTAESHAPEAPATHEAASVPSPGGSGPATVSADHSVVVGELARRLRAVGLTVHEDYGSSRQRIDLVVDPLDEGSPALAVEADGPSYAAMRSVRDRDRLRPEHLTRLGWTHVRVWTTDLFRDPARDVSRILNAARFTVDTPTPDASLAADAPSAAPSADAPEGPAEPGGDATGGSEPGRRADAPITEQPGGTASS
ncbi:conserved hypothetical protein [Nostocoides japonicum T1-X7]|uniref:DNA helicase n=1 Tax=Nostocoides japonicum T1-X7 TaxID=1194083 RepID=A0A077M432_9MICO|nr:AAA domain-containing protein [Tetrasphaera japonica]CCH79837.1 conserved hypothetical protein [Tetrasphaera japonica T1-X7]